ncbi:UNVERIFIED_CONTAM: hypothetical protein Sangu_2970100 [Sesamum angustifolium]|uniref:DUF4216 domain-containing protein n=1 Tax=Sesamum angustifolium TaxID=2727405 RepID=A0AAW2IJY1_9LAMI
MVEILCKFEKIFPPGCFDSMEHLPINLAYEAKVGGPVQYRWMYAFERKFYEEKRQQFPRITNMELDIIRDHDFRQWLLVHIQHTQNEVDDVIRKLANGPSSRVSCYKGYFVNGFKFHTVEYGQSKATTNYGVCVLGSTYSECEVDYNGLLEEVVELEYYGLGHAVTLFKCHWYDNSDIGLKRHRSGLVEINRKLKLSTNDPFILASQAHQVYFTSFPSTKRERRDWWAVCKVKATGKFKVPLAKGQDDSVELSVENAFQEGEASNPQPIFVANNLDEINIISDEEAEEVNSIEFEALRHAMDSYPTKIGDEEHDEEEEFEEIESEEDSQDDEDHNSSDSDKDDDMEIDD